MKSFADHFTAKAGGVLGFLVMAVVGWNLAGAPVPTSDEPAAEPKNRRVDRETRRSKPTGPGTLVGKRLETIRAAGTQEARLRATFDLANSLSSSEIATWLNGDWFTIRGGPERLLFRNILLARWRETDPDALLVWSFKNDTGAGRNVLTSWTEKEPQRLIDFFKSHPDETAELRALRNLAKLHPALALQRLQEMAADGISTKGVGNSFDLLRQLAEKSPSALEATLDSLPPAVRSQAESALCGQRLATSFSTEVRALWDRPDGWKIFQANVSEELQGKVFDELANMPPAWKSSIAENYYNFISEENAGKWLDSDLAGLGFSAAQVKRLRTHALGNLARKNPEEALKRMGGMDLNANTRQNLISNMFSSLADEPEKAEALIARLDSEEDRKHARTTLDARKSGQTQAKAASPAEWLEKISAVDPKSAGNASQYVYQLEQWDTARLAELNKQFQAMSDDRKLQTAQVIAAGRRYGDPNSPVTGEAIRYLVVNPVARTEGQNDSDTDPLRLASEYASKLAIKDPGAASEWVGTLPAGDAKLWAQKNVAKNWAVYDPKAAEQWVASLPVDARSEVRAFMKKGK